MGLAAAGGVTRGRERTTLTSVSGTKGDLTLRNVFFVGPAASGGSLPLYFAAFNGGNAADKLLPGDPRIALNTALAYEKSGRLDEAQKRFEALHAARQDPDPGVLPVPEPARKPAERVSQLHLNAIRGEIDPESPPEASGTPCPVPTGSAAFSKDAARDRAMAD